MIGKGGGGGGGAGGGLKQKNEKFKGWEGVQKSMFSISPPLVCFPSYMQHEFLCSYLSWFRLDEAETTESDKKNMDENMTIRSQEVHIAR